MASYPTTAVSYGQTSANVTALQNFLISQGMSIPAGATGYFGDQTKTALQQWQAKNGISSSTPGYGTDWGPLSIAAAQKTTAAPISGVTPTSQPISGYTYNASTGTISATAAPVIPPTTQPVAPVVPPTTQPTAPAAVTHKPLDPATLAGITSNLGPNMSNDPAQVTILQNALVAAGYLTPAQVATGPGIYGPQTTAAVTQWQSENPSIQVGSGAGYFGPASKAFLGLSSSSSINPNTTKTTPPSGEVTDTTHALDSEALGIPDSLVNTTLGNLPPEAYRTVIPQLKPGTPEYQAAMDKIDVSMFDIMQQQMNAQTEQQQQAAQYNWETLKKSIETNLNVTLSNDALQAWDQIQNVKNTFGQQNLEGSGMQNEAMDSYLRKIRNTDAQARVASQSKEDQSQQDYYMKFATPAQVQALISSNPEKARQWGLIPSAEIKAALTPAALKAKYPGMTDEQIQANIASVLDENGNYRSNLYQSYMTGGNVGINKGNISTIVDQYGQPISKTVTASDTGMLDINAARNEAKATGAEIANANIDRENRLTMGSNPVTSGAASASASGTQFNTPTNTPQITVPPQLTSAGASSTPTSNPATLSNPLGTTTTPKPTTTTTTPSTTATTPAISTMNKLPADFATNAAAYTFTADRGWVKK